jgi:hypothetical protein
VRRLRQKAGTITGISRPFQNKKEKNSRSKGQNRTNIPHSAMTANTSRTQAADPGNTRFVQVGRRLAAALEDFQDYVT